MNPDAPKMMTFPIVEIDEVKVTPFVASTCRNICYTLWM